MLGLLGHRVVDPRNPLAVRSGLHVELLGVMNYREYMCMCMCMCMCLCMCTWGDARVAGQPSTQLWSRLTAQPGQRGAGAGYVREKLLLGSSWPAASGQVKTSTQFQAPQWRHS